MIDAINVGKVDLLTTTDPTLTANQREDFKKSDYFSVHETVKIKNYFVSFFRVKTDYE